MGAHAGGRFHALLARNCGRPYKARYAIARVHGGRSVGSRLNVRDVASTWCRRRKDVQVESLDRAEPGSGLRAHLIEDRRAGPAEIAAARLDVAAWFRTLPRRDRRIAKALAAGETTSATAMLFNMSAARVSQLRHELRQSWRIFQGELGATGPTASACASC